MYIHDWDEIIHRKDKGRGKVIFFSMPNPGGGSTAGLSIIQHDLSKPLLDIQNSIMSDC